VDADSDSGLRKLWDTDALVARLEQKASALAESKDRLPELTSEEFAHESLVLGSEAISTLLRDPLLPDELCDPEPYRRLVEITRDYQNTAQDIWGRLLGLEGSRAR
jgi:phenylacetic acid degradation operon negative regulatory protein